MNKNILGDIISNILEVQVCGQADDRVYDKVYLICGI